MFGEKTQNIKNRLMKETDMETKYAKKSTEDKHAVGKKQKNHFSHYK